MSRPFRLSKVAVLAVHGRLLADHGGVLGLRDESRLESALAAPESRFQHEKADVFEWAATFVHALTGNRPFVDGNKRTAFAAAGIFLELNGYRLTASEPDAAMAVLALSRGEMNADEFCTWLRISSVEMNEADGGERLATVRTRT